MIKNLIDDINYALVEYVPIGLTAIAVFLMVWSMFMSPYTAGDRTQIIQTVLFAILFQLIAVFLILYGRL